MSSLLTYPVSATLGNIAWMMTPAHPTGGLARGETQQLRKCAAKRSIVATEGPLHSHSTTTTKHRGARRCLMSLDLYVTH